MKYLYFTKADKKFIIENIRKRAWEMMDNTRRKKMSLEVAIGLVLIVAFVVTIFKRWFSPYAALVFCAAGMRAGLLRDERAVPADRI